MTRISPSRGSSTCEGDAREEDAEDAAILGGRQLHHDRNRHRQLSPHDAPFSCSEREKGGGGGVSTTWYILICKSIHTYISMYMSLAGVSFTMIDTDTGS